MQAACVSSPTPAITSITETGHVLREYEVCGREIVEVSTVVMSDGSLRCPTLDYALYVASDGEIFHPSSVPAGASHIVRHVDCNGTSVEVSCTDLPPHVIYRTAGIRRDTGLETTIEVRRVHRSVDSVRYLVVAFVSRAGRVCKLEILSKQPFDTVDAAELFARSKASALLESCIGGVR